MLSDDLSSLFAAPSTGAAANAQFRQGRILTFSSVDGSNQVVVGTSVIPNVPMLLTGAEVEYSPGDPVMLMVLGNTYMLLGKVAMVGSPQFASASGATASGQHSSSGQTFASSFTRYDTVVLTVPVWANTASVVVIGSMSCLYSGAGVALLQVNAGITGQTFNSPASAAVDSNVGWVGQTQGFASKITGLTGGSTIQGEVNGEMTGSNINGVSSISMLATFTKQ